MRRLVRVLGQGAVVEVLGRLGIQPQVELVPPAELKTGARESASSRP